MNAKTRSDIRRKLRILSHAKETANISKTCRYFGISREIFYRWKRAYEALGETARTDNGHEFQSQFHWHLLDQGIDHVYIKPRTPRLNGKVERSHLIDDREIYQLLEYKDDDDLCEKLKIWEEYHNFHRPHGAHKGITPYESLRERLAL